MSIHETGSVALTRHFHKHLKLGIMALMPTLYSHIFAVFFIIWIGNRDCLSRLQTLLVFLILNGTAKTKLAIHCIGILVLYGDREKLYW